MGDVRGTIEHHLWRAVEAQLPAFDELANRLTEREQIQLAREAAATIAGPLIWRELLGDDRLDTTHTARLLGVTRQALNKRVQAHTILGVPGRGTTWFPAWQFDLPKQRIRAIVEPLLQPWADAAAEGSLPWDARRLLSWAATAQPELGDATPEDWVLADRDHSAVIAASRRAVRAASA